MEWDWLPDYIYRYPDKSPYSLSSSILASDEGEGCTKLDGCLLVISRSKAADTWSCDTNYIMPGLVMNFELSDIPSFCNRRA